MKIILSILAAFGIVWLLTRKNTPYTPPGMLTPEQKDVGNNSVLDTYRLVVPPIAQLDKVPWTQTNLRMVDPYIQPPIYDPAIYQNGNN